MVLIGSRRSALLAAVLLAGVACVPKHEPVRAKTPLTVAVAAIYDGGDRKEVGAVPEAVSSEILEALADRNLKPRLVPAASLEKAFAARRTTAHRLAHLAQRAPEADLLLLVETNARFYSQLSGRYRWTVQARSTLARAPAKNGTSGPGEIQDVTETELDIATFLDFDHEREPEALGAASGQIGTAVGRLTDDFLGGLLAGAFPPGASVVSDARTGRLPARLLASASFSGPGVGGSVAPWAGAERDIDAHRPRAARLEASAGGLRAEPGRSMVPGASIRRAEKKSDSIYFVLVDRFANGDRSNDGKIDLSDPQAWHGGDLQGIIDRLDHIQGLGIRTVWISPVFAMRTSKFHEYGAYHGYWLEDFGTVEPRLGSEALLKKLRDELHRRDMRLVLDVVLNHVAPDAPLTRERPEWFHGKGGITDWEDPVQLETHDVFGLPDLSQEKEEVYRYLLDHSLRWIDRVRPDGFRLDAARHIPIEFWSRYNRDVRAHAGPDFQLLGEMYDGDAVGLSRTLREGGFDAVFDFPLYFAMTDVFCKDAPVSRLGATLFSDRMYDDPSRLVTFLDNHDVPRALSACGGDIDRVTQALTFLLTARGTPSITYGTDAGLTGAEEPANRADMRFDPDHRLYSEIQALLALRDEHPALARGVSRLLTLEGGLFAYARLVAEEVVVIAVNRGDRPAEVRLPEDLTAATAGIRALYPEAKTIRTGSNKEPEKARTLVVEPESVRVFALFPRFPRGFAVLADRPVSTTRTLRKIEVRVSGIRLKKGESLWIAGSGEELGRWQPARAAGLSRKKKDTHSATLQLPEGGVFEWKLVLRDAKGTFHWESGPNRPLFIRPGTSRVSATWREESAVGATR